MLINIFIVLFTLFLYGYAFGSRLLFPQYVKRGSTAKTRIIRLNCLEDDDYNTYLSELYRYVFLSDLSVKKLFFLEKEQ